MRYCHRIPGLLIRMIPNGYMGLSLEDIIYNLLWMGKGFWSARWRKGAYKPTKGVINAEYTFNADDHIVVAGLKKDLLRLMDI